MKKIRQIATPSFPLPHKENQSVRLRGDTTLKTVLSSEKAVHCIRKNLPPPNVLEAFQDILNELSYEKQDDDNLEKTRERGRPMLLVGERGCGKTSALITACLLVTGEAPASFDCGNRSLDDLVIETVFDENAASAILTIQNRFNGLEHPPLSPLSRKQILNEVPSEMITQNEQSQPILDIYNADNVQINDTLLQTFVTISELEGIGKGSKLGITFKEGPLIKACREGRPLLIDEVDKAIEGTGTSLQQIWTAISGLSAPYHFEKNGISYTFSPEHVREGFIPVLTANDAGDGLEVSGLKESTRDRLQIINVSKSSPEDIAVRIGQSLLGYNYHTIEACLGSKTSVAESFIKLAELAGEDPDRETKILIEAYPQTIQACRQLGKFYYEWAQLIDPNNPRLDDPQLEDARAIGLQPPGVRMAQDDIKKAYHFQAHEYLDEATRQKGETLDITSLIKIAETEKIEQPKVNPMGLGEKIENTILKRISQFAGGPEVKKEVTILAIQNGILPEPDEENNKNIDTTLIRDLLDTRAPEISISPETYELHGKLVETLIKKYPELTESDPEKILPPAQLQTTINEMQEKAREKNSHSVSYILGINPDYATTNSGEPILILPVYDAQERDQIPTIQEHMATALVPTQELIEVISHKNIRESILAGLWTDSWKERINNILHDEDDPTDTNSTAIDEEEETLSGNNPNLRIIRILTQNKEGKAERMLIADCRRKNKTMIFGNNLENTKKDGLITSCDPEEFAKILIETTGIPENEIAVSLETITERKLDTAPIDGELIMTKADGDFVERGEEVCKIGNKSQIATQDGIVFYTQEVMENNQVEKGQNIFFNQQSETLPLELQIIDTVQAKEQIGQMKIPLKIKIKEEGMTI